MTWLRAVEAGMGRRAAWAAAGAVALGTVAFATGLGAGGARRTLAALTASWLFFAGAAAGAVAFRAFFRIVEADWARPLGAIGGVQAAFVPAAAIVLLAILAGAVAVPWIPHATGWLAAPNLVVRELALNAVLLGLAYFWLRPRPGRQEPPSRPLAIAYCIVYAVVLSVWAFDFVLGPDPVWSSTLIGPYVFMGAFVAGTGTVTLLGLARGSLGERERRDAGALVLALAIFWAYLFWSQYLTIWYANLPDEIGFALRRSIDGWGWVVVAVIGLVFVLPFLGLLHPAGRRSPRVLGALLVAELVGLWLNCHLLVVPSLAPPGSAPVGLRDLLMALGMLGGFALSVAPAARRQRPA
jgi:hypothetical protein